LCTSRSLRVLTVSPVPVSLSFLFPSYYHHHHYHHDYCSRGEFQLHLVPDAVCKCFACPPQRYSPCLCLPFSPSPGVRPSWATVPSVASERENGDESHPGARATRGDAFRRPAKSPLWARVAPSSSYPLGAPRGLRPSTSPSAPPGIPTPKGGGGALREGG